jgi:Coenzyme PQQ synthesis protein D (PqqD)
MVPTRQLHHGWHGAIRAAARDWRRWAARRAGRARHDVGRLPMRVAKDVEAIEFEGCLLLVGQGRQMLLILNESARIVWETMRAGVGADEMAALLSQSYRIPLARTRDDVTALLDRWRAHELLDAGSDRQPASGWHLAEPGVATRPAIRRDFGVERVYNPCGTAFRLAVEPPDLQRWLDRLLAHAAIPGTAPRDVIELFRDGTEHVVTHNGSERQRSDSVDEAAGAVVRAICDLSYPDADWSLFMHAAAVGRGDHAIVLAGPNGSGKSTLTAALIRSGFEYFSDDVVPFDCRAMRIVPVPFALSIKEGSWATLADLYPILDDLPTFESYARQVRFLSPPERAVRHAGASVRALVFPRFRPGQGLGLERLAPADALVDLAAVSRPLALDRRRLHRTLAWVRTVPAYRLTYTHLTEASDIIQELFAD